MASTSALAETSIPPWSSRWALAATLRAWCGTWLARILHLAERVKQGAGQLGVSTEELIRRFQQGQNRAFEALYDRFKDMVYRIALYTIRDGAEAEEAVQDTFVDLLRALPSYRIQGPAQFETWLYRVTVNRCRSRMRRKPIPSAEWEDVEEQLEQLPDEQADHDPEDTALRQERALALWQAIDRLSESQRMVVMLRYEQGLSYRQIAEVLDVNEGTVRSRLYYAHQKLKERMIRQGS